jgi:hypothetical protein
MGTRISPFESMLDFEHLNRELDAMQGVQAIACDPLTEASCTLIETANSFYLFRVTAPHARRGLLAGGVVGESPVSAVLIGVLPAGTEACEGSILSVGTRAVFVVEKNGFWKSIITSRIARLAYSAARAHEPLAASH